MDCRAVILSCLAVFLILVLSQVEGRNKKVVIHIPYKVKKIKHTHTIYKTIHHHHAHHDHDHDPMYLGSPSEDHEHFHHMHLHEEPGPAQHSQPVPGIGLPDFLPDVPLELPLQLHDAPAPLPNGRHLIPLFRRA